jgi:hypothetical protein
MTKIQKNLINKNLFLKKNKPYIIVGDIYTYYSIKLFFDI